MNNKKDLNHLNEFHEVPYFDANDHKILAFEMFRGPSIGLTSDFDLTNPGRKPIVKENQAD